MIKRMLISIWFLGLCSLAFAQSDSLVEHNIRALENYALANPIEKVHLHLDRQLYFTGDTVWFKAYVVLGESHKPSALSGILYAELINPKDSIEQRLNLRIDSGACPGEFVLPGKLQPGVYHIRAYTNWMRNAGPAYFYDEPVTVASSLTSHPYTVPGLGAGLQVNRVNSGSNDQPDVQFFPEGGSLVNGLRSKVAFKAINPNGLAEEIKGVIMDNAGKEVATFGTQHLGMGAFPLEPGPGKSYFARVTSANGKTFAVPLPPARDAGFSIALNSSFADSLYVKVAACNTKDSVFFLMAQSAGKVYFATAPKLTARVFTAALAKNRFPSGIVQFILFSQNGEPLNERDVFIQNDNDLNLTLFTAKPAYAPGEQVKFGMEAEDRHGAVAGNFSVSVTDETKAPLNENAESTIFTDLLLKSELGGYIQDPNYYFIHPDDSTRSDLDLLILTQGYHRFEWKKIQAGATTTPVYKPEKGLSLKGVVRTIGGKAIPGGEVILTSTKNVFVQDMVADAEGKFVFNDLLLPDTSKVLINAKKANGGNHVKISVMEPDKAPVNIVKYTDGYIAADFTPEMRQAVVSWRADSLSRSIMLKEVKVKGESLLPLRKRLLQASANLNGPGNADFIFMPDRPLVGSTLANALVAKLLSVDIRNGIPYYVHAKTKAAMSIYIDGTEYDAMWWDLVNPDDVYSIEVLLNPLWTDTYGPQGRGGVLVITTKAKAGIAQEIYAPHGLILYKFKGYYTARTFYSPKYSPAAPTGRKDNRITVYWNPAINTGPDGKASFEYINAGTPGNYRVVIEGMDNDGNLGRQVFNYKVQ